MWSISVSARLTSTEIRSVKAPPSFSTSSKSHRRISVATWSLRERPVWSLPNNGPQSVGIDGGRAALTSDGTDELAETPLVGSVNIFVRFLADK
jgi:hypothetical protein